MTSQLGTRPPVRVAAIQQSVGEEIEANVNVTLGKILEAASGGARLVVTQELVTSRYFCQTEDHRWFDTGVSIPGEVTDRFGEASRESNVVLVISLFECRAPGLFHNTAVVFDADGTMVGRYRKMHIPDDPLYYEKFYFTPGDVDRSENSCDETFRDGFHAVDTAVGRVGVIVCWDQWFPEAARLTALDGADFLCVPTAIGHHPCEKETAGPAQLDAWQTIQRSHAIANGLFVVVPNRTGFEPTPDGQGEGIDFWGNSFVVGPDGAIVANASRDDEEIIYADCDPNLIDEQRQNWPFFRDRRVDAYGGLLDRWRQRG